MTINVIHSEWPIQKFLDIKEKNFIYSEEYQRSKIWKPQQKVRLIDSIFKGYPIGTIILRRIKYNEKTGFSKYEVLDGQQRLTTIFDFLKRNLIASAFDINGWEIFHRKKYNDLTKTQQVAFKNRKIGQAVIWGVKGDSDMVGDMFLRLQEGEALKAPEKLNALKGRMRNTIINLSKNKIFDSCKIEKRRFTHRYMCAQIFLLELESNFEDSDFPNLRYIPLKKMYETYKGEEFSKNNPPKKVVGHINRTLNALIHILKGDYQLLRDRGDFIPYYLMISRFLKEYSIGKKEKKKLKELTQKFFPKVIAVNIEEINKKNYEKEGIIRKYAIVRTIGLTKEAFRKKEEYLFNFFLENMPSLKLKDNNKKFNWEQKITIYYRDKKKCLECKRAVQWEKAKFHHKRFRSSGGLTTVKNGVVVHENCHKKIHIRDKDEDEFL